MPPFKKLKIDLVEHPTVNTKVYERLTSRKHGGHRVIGLDCEWDVVRKRGEAVEKLSLVQVARANGYCALFRLDKIPFVPEELKDILADESFIKVGVGILSDEEKLWKYYGLQAEPILDIRHVADVAGIDTKEGLNHLFKAVLGTERKKHRFGTYSWSSKSYSERQMHFAALDAVNSALIFNKLNQERIFKVFRYDSKDWSLDDYHDATVDLWKNYFGKEFDYKESKYYRKRGNKIKDYD